MSSTEKNVPGSIRATIVHNESSPDECTLHPARPREDEHTTAWITAREGSFVRLASCR